MDEATQPNAALVEEAAAAAEALMEQARQLTELVGRYDTGAGAASVVWSGHERREMDEWRATPAPRKGLPTGTPVAQPRAAMPSRRGRPVRHLPGRPPLIPGGSW